MTTLTDNALLDLSSFSTENRKTIFSFASFLNEKENEYTLTEEEEFLIKEAEDDINSGRVLTMRDIFHEKVFESLV